MNVSTLWPCWCFGHMVTDRDCRAEVLVISSEFSSIFLWLVSVVMDQNRTSNRHILSVSSVGRFHQAVGSSRLGRKSTKNMIWHSQKSMQELFHLCLFALQVFGIPCLPTQIPECNDAPTSHYREHVFHTRQDGLLSDPLSGGEQPTLPILFSTPRLSEIFD